MANIQVAIFRTSSVLSDDDVAAAVPALQSQIHNHFAPEWGIDADLYFVRPGENPPQDAWWLDILDDPDAPNTAGRHELSPEGRPYGKIFVKYDQSLNIPWTVVASHELLEMLADPNAHLAVFAQPQPYANFLYAYEVCDPCESQPCWYTIGAGVQVSDFVLPTWFEPLPTETTQFFDYRHRITAPLQPLPGCHMDVYDLSWCRWRVFYGEGTTTQYGAPSFYGSRRARRKTPRNLWRRTRVSGAPVEVTGAPRSIAEQTGELLRQVQELQDALSRYRRR
jgi:hypothetical protein